MMLLDLEYWIKQKSYFVEQIHMFNVRRLTTKSKQALSKWNWEYKIQNEQYTYILIFS